MLTSCILYVFPSKYNFSCTQEWKDHTCTNFDKVLLSFIPGTCCHFTRSIHNTPIKHLFKKKIKNTKMKKKEHVSFFKGCTWAAPLHPPVTRCKWCPDRTWNPVLFKKKKVQMAKYEKDIHFFSFEALLDKIQNLMKFYRGGAENFKLWWNGVLNLK